MTWREYVWVLEGWSKLTGMAATEKGVALALSLGGKAATIAQSIPQNVLSQTWGLPFLLWNLEQAFAQEEQELQRIHFDKLMRLGRAKGSSGRDHVTQFELAYNEAVKAGAFFSVVMKSHLLLRTARLSEADEKWVLQCVAGDLNRYEDIRASLRRLHLTGESHQQYYVADADAPGDSASICYSNQDQTITTITNPSESWSSAPAWPSSSSTAWQQSTWAATETAVDNETPDNSIWFETGEEDADSDDCVTSQ